MIGLPKTEKSLWQEFNNGPSYPELNKDLSVDTVIIGAGITGLTAAYLLKQAGQKVAVLEKETVGSGTTGRTTGKVTSQHNIIYEQLISQHGKLKTQAYADANEAAISQIGKVIKTHDIDCEWNRAPHYVYTAKAEEVGRFKAEAKAAKSLNLPVSYETKIPLPFAVKAAIKFENQASFNSQKYLAGLAKVVHGGGCYVFENSQAKIIKDGKPAIVKTNKATIEAKDVIVATHVPTFPLVARGSYGFLEYPTESFLISAEVKSLIKGMYISPDEHHYSILPIKVNRKNMILIGGEGGNIPGMRLSKQKRYERLAKYAVDHFGATRITNKWSDMDYMGYDNLPLVGKLYPWSRHRYTATGYMKWGLTNGTAAAMILKDLILGEPNPWHKTFDSTRLDPLKYIPKAVIKKIAG